MDRDNQERMVNELCDNLKEALLERLPRFPEDWDGIEIRQLFADIAREQFANRPMTSGRKLSYRNVRLIENL